MTSLPGLSETTLRTLPPHPPKFKSASLRNGSNMGGRDLGPSSVSFSKTTTQKCQKKTSKAGNPPTSWLAQIRGSKAGSPRERLWRSKVAEEFYVGENTQDPMRASLGPAPERSLLLQTLKECPCIFPWIPYVVDNCSSTHKGNF